MTTPTTPNLLRRRHIFDDWKEAVTLMQDAVLRDEALRDDEFDRRRTLHLCDMSFEMERRTRFASNLREGWNPGLVDEVENGAVPFDHTHLPEGVAVLLANMVDATRKGEPAVVEDGILLYRYYLEDLFDDVTAALEHQREAMKE